MLRPYTVSFFGHRIIEDFNRAEAKVEALIRELILQKEYVEFLVGRSGDFDQIVSSAAKRLQRRIRSDNSSLVWVLPYPTAELRNHEESFQAYTTITLSGSGRIPTTILKSSRAIGRCYPQISACTWKWRLSCSFPDWKRWRKRLRRRNQTVKTRG